MDFARFDTSVARRHWRSYPLQITDHHSLRFFFLLRSETAISWEEQCGSWDKQDRVKDVEFERDYEYSHSWSMEDCQYNWKVLCDNFNECYHCGSSHPGESEDLLFASASCRGLD